ncbi:MAG: hypothetical protein NTY98_02570 [Verrucomicrobia bacterium]|nr:hypothetical protein [Verrucomicrobiota bacterium]
MMNTSPLTGLFALCVLSCIAAMLAGAVALGFVFAAASIASHGCIRQNEARTCSPRPVITYLQQARACEPLISLQRGQFVTEPWPHTLQVHLPAGVRLQILEATPERIRVMAV